MERSPLTQGITESPFLQPHSALLRIWHWLTFILITISILTVLLNSTLLDPRNNANAVQYQLKSQGITIDNQQAFFIAHHFDDQLWDLHRLLGIGISVLLLFRITLEFIMPADQRNVIRLSDSIKNFRDNKTERSGSRHLMGVRVSYTLFYAILILMSLTGLSLAFDHAIGITETMHRTIKEIHATLQWAVYAFVLLHIGGVIIADLGRAKGIVSGMINGNR